MHNLSKVFENFIFRKISDYMGSFFSKYQCGFKEDYSTQHCLLSMVEKKKRAVFNWKLFRLFLTDLSQLFDYLSHKLLLVKLHACVFNFAAQKLVHSYFKNWKQRTKLNSKCNSCQEKSFRFSEGSILRSLFSNISLCNMFLRSFQFVAKIGLTRSSLLQILW